MPTRRLGPWVPLMLAIVLVAIGVGVYATRPSSAPSVPLVQPLSRTITDFRVVNATVTEAERGKPADLTLRVENGTNLGVTLLHVDAPRFGTAYLHVDPDMTDPNATMSGLPLLPLGAHQVAILSTKGLGAMVMASRTSLTLGSNVAASLTWQDSSGVTHHMPFLVRVVTRPTHLYFGKPGGGMSGMKM